MELNKIQRAIYDEYMMKRKVWADCPRQSGKTLLLTLVATIETSQGNKVFIRSFSQRSKERILQLIPKKHHKNIVKKEEDADVVLYDEVYYDMLQKHGDKRVICVRTKPHKTLKFGFDDLEDKAQQHANKLREMMTEAEWEKDFD